MDDGDISPPTLSLTPPPPSQTSAPTSPSDRRRLSKGTITGIVLGILFAFLLIYAFLLERRKARDTASNAITMTRFRIQRATTAATTAATTSRLQRATATATTIRAETTLPAERVATATTTALDTEDASLENPHQILLADVARLSDVFSRDGVV